MSRVGFRVPITTPIAEAIVTTTGTVNTAQITCGGCGHGVKIGIRSLGHCPMMPHFATNALSLGPRLRRQAPRLRRAVRGFGA